MPATTVSQLAPLLSSYVEPNGDFKNSLNQVLARMYNMGTYRDLTVQYSLPIMNNHVTLPDDAESILHTMINGSPSPVRALWHDYRSVGSNYNGGDKTWGLIDSGYWPTIQLIPTPKDIFYVVPASSSPTKRTLSADGGTIHVIGTDGTSVYTADLNLESGELDFPNAVSDFTSITFDGLTDQYDIRTVKTDPKTTLATVGPDSGVSRYRRFRVSRPQSNETTVHVLCKRAFQPVQNDNDIVYISNVGAIKHGMLGRVAEDNADIERADYHWNKCMLLLEEEIASARGAALPRLNVDPFGTGNMNRMRSIL